MWYERCLSKLREITAMPWVLFSCGAWMSIACIRGQNIRYRQWRMRRLEAERDRYQRMARDLERRLARDEEIFGFFPEATARKPPSPSQALPLSNHTSIERFHKEPRVADETDQVNQSDEQRMHRQFATVFEQLINIARFALPFVLVLLDDTDNVIGSKAVETSDNPNALEAIDFVVSKGAEDGLSYPMHVMVRDAHGHVAYVYLDDLDTQPDMKIVHIDEDE